MSTTEHVRDALRAVAETADHLDEDAVWANVRTGIRRRRRRRAAASAAGAALLVAGVVVGVPWMDESWSIRTEPAGPVLPTVAEPTPDGDPEPDPTPDEEEQVAAPAVEVPREALLPVETEPRTTLQGVVAWQLPRDCTRTPPLDAVGMVTARDGTGEYEAQIPLQQVALFADATQATAEVERLVVALEACVAASDLVRTEPVDAGDGAIGAAEHYGDGAGGATPFGTYTVISRRGNAVVLVSAQGGEGTPDGNRDRVVERARQAWEPLCAYEGAGC